MSNIYLIFELAYFISGIIFSVVAIFVLRRLGDVKTRLKDNQKSVSISSRRKALRSASEQITLFQNAIIPIINDVEGKIEDEDIRFFENSACGFTDGKFDFVPVIGDDEKEKLVKVSRDLIELINALENFAVYFTSNIADERYAYRAIGNAYCTAIRRYLPFILLFESTTDEKLEALRLYILWNSRIEKNKLLQQQVIIDGRQTKIVEPGAVPGDLAYAPNGQTDS